MKQIAESHLNQKVRDAVITVPAYFNKAQHQATIDAGKISEMNVSIINETTAAALPYGFLKRDISEYVLVFDLGGGTFGVSIFLKTMDGFLVKSTLGDNRLGGQDFTNRMLNYLIEQFKHNSCLDISKNKTNLAYNRMACENAKCLLTEQDQVDIELHYENTKLTSTISRHKFEELNIDLFQKTIDLVDEAIISANMEKEKISQVILVGGSTCIPKVKELVRNFFNGKQLFDQINPDEAVTFGSAIEADSILKKSQMNESYDELDCYALSEVTPFSLGIKNSAGKMLKYLRKRIQ